MTCQLTRTELHGLFKDSKYGKDIDAFEAYFEAGSKQDAKCLCGRFIRQHAQQQQPPPVLDSGETQQQQQPQSASLDRLLQIFGSREKGSDKSSLEFSRGLKGKPRFWECAVCGFCFQRPDGTITSGRTGSARTCLDRNGSVYPDPISRQNAPTLAHILTRTAHCEECEVKWDETNYLPLCGNEDQVPSCHSAFDRHLLAIIHYDDHWVAKSSNSKYIHLNDKVLTKIPAPMTPGAPHRTILHAHALACFNEKQLEAPNPYNKLEHTPPGTLGEEDAKLLAAGGLEYKPSNPTAHTSAPTAGGGGDDSGDNTQLYPEQKPKEPTQDADDGEGEELDDE